MTRARLQPRIPAPDRSQSELGHPQPVGTRYLLAGSVVGDDGSTLHLGPPITGVAMVASLSQLCCADHGQERKEAPFNGIVCLPGYCWQFSFGLMTVAPSSSGRSSDCLITTPSRLFFIVHYRQTRHSNHQPPTTTKHALWNALSFPSTCRALSQSFLSLHHVCFLACLSNQSFANWPTLTSNRIRPPSTRSPFVPYP